MTQDAPRTAFLVLLRDGASRVLGTAAGAEASALVAAGWETVWDAASSEAEGQAFAARVPGALPDGYDDRLSPRRMASPVALFRSVSPGELADIAGCGLVQGKLNAFNPFDRRRLVFFGPAMTTRLVGQGEEVERAVEAAFADHPDLKGFDAIAATRGRLLGEFLKGLDRIAGKVERQRAGQARRRPVLDPRRRADAQGGSVPTARALYRDLPQDPRMDRLAASLSELDARESALRERIKLMVREAVRDERARRLDLDVTSAVVETRPLAHGFHYSLAFGRSGMGDEDEYGFLPGTVAVDDLVRVHLVRRGEVVDTLAADMIDEAVARFSEAPAPGMAL